MLLLCQASDINSKKNISWPTIIKCAEIVCLLDKTTAKKLEFEDFSEINKSQVNIFRLKGYIEQ